MCSLFACPSDEVRLGYCSVMGNAGGAFLPWILLEARKGFSTLFEDFENGQPANFWLRDVWLCDDF